MSDDITVSIDTSPVTVVTVDGLGIRGPGFTGGSYDTGTGVVTFSSDDGLGFSTSDLRENSVFSVSTGAGLTGGPITDNGTVSLDAGSIASLELADSAQQPPVEGAFVDGDKTKLNGIEASADVTDTGNVTAAGALMDSEVPNLAQVKAFDTTDYATAAQGSTADTALQSSDIGSAVQAFSNVLANTTASFLTAEKSKLTGIEALADVTDTLNVTAAGALMDSEVPNLADVKAINQSLVSGATPTFGIGSMTLDDTSLVVADTTDLQTFVNKTDAALLKARGTGVTSSYVSTAAAGGTTFAQPAVNGEIASDQGYFAIAYAGATGITVANLTAKSTHVYVDNAGDLQQQTSTPTRQDWSRKMFTMRIAVDTVAETILGFEYFNNPIGHYANSIRDIYQALLAQGVPFKGGQLITGRAGDLGFDVGSGTITEFGGTGDIDNANVLSLDAVANATYDLLERSAIAAVNQTNLVQSWDNAGTITTLGSGTFVAHRLYRFSNGQFAIQYGQGNYANIVLARAGLLIEDYVLNERLTNATFFGWWLIGQTASNTLGTDNLTEFREYTIGVQGGSSSGLAGCLLKGNNLSDLLDVSVAQTNIELGTGDSPTFTGVTTTADAEFNGVDVGRGGGNVSSNTASGLLALDGNTTGSNNTASGRQALFTNTEGYDNTASGSLSLQFNTTGSGNTAFGRLALRNNTTGVNNTGSGSGALENNTTGTQNTATGNTAMQNNTTGNYNTATGFQSLQSNTTGDFHTATGRFALNANTTGVNNTANGASALSSNTTGSNNVANGLGALASNTTGGNNVANGFQALQLNTTGNDNTATGYQALQDNTTGGNNVANGFQALNANTTGANNTAHGYQSLQDNTTGNANTATGLQALQNNTIGNSNTANGFQALRNNTEGNSNVANGRNALIANTTGSFNTATGFEALESNTTADSNTAHGYQVLFANTTGGNNTATGSGALQNNTTGNSNTATGVQALQENTTASNNTAIGYQALQLNTTGGANTATGRYALSNNSTGGNNVATGVQALLRNTTGGSNTATGTQALQENLTGDNNTATGFHAMLDNTTGSFNVAAGYQALSNNTTGTSNTAHGYQVLFANTTGGNNTATGVQALQDNTVGLNNTAFGREALESNTTASNNTAVGYQALFLNTTGTNNVANGRSTLSANITGDNNTAQGNYALLSNTTGSSNTAAGYDALANNTTGSFNTALGRDALKNNTTGSGNVGFGARTSAGTYAPVFDTTTEDNRLVAGHTSVTNAYVQVAWTVVSDERDKTELAPVPHGLDFVNALEPIEFEFRVGGRDGKGDGIKRYGWSSQAILALEGENPVLVNAEDPDNLKLTDSYMLPIHGNAIRTLSGQIEELKTQIETLKSQLENKS